MDKIKLQVQELLGGESDLVSPDRRTAHGHTGDKSFVFLGSKVKNKLRTLKIHRANCFITGGGLDLHVV